MTILLMMLLFISIIPLTLMILTMQPKSMTLLVLMITIILQRK